MEIGIYGSDYTKIKSLEKLFTKFNIETFKVTKSNAKADCIVVLGGDRGVRNFFHNSFGSAVPVLGVGESESNGFLTQVDIKDLSNFLQRLQNKDYTTQLVPVLQVQIDGKNTFGVLNDVSIFPAKSAVIMEHTLRVNQQDVWHDSGDGIIVSTPLGSSAYSMSAGGPILFQESNVFGIVPVNSLDVTRRPLIVADSSLVVVDDIYSSIQCEVILDGIQRMRVKNTVKCTKSVPASIIRFDKKVMTISALANKVQLAEDLLKMPPSFKFLLKTLEYEGSLTRKEISVKTMLPDRTVRLALSHLLEKGYIRRKISTRDSRQRIYEIVL